MSSSTSPSSSGQPEDPWEQLAEDLFGLEYGKEHAAREDRAERPDPAAPETASARPAPSEEGQSAYDETAPEPVDAPPRFAASGRIEEDITEEPGQFGVADERSRETSQPDEAVADESARPVSPQDSYWDALANWNWDESEGGSSRPRTDRSADDTSRARGGSTERGGGPRSRDEGRGGRRGSERTQRRERSSAAPPAPSPAQARAPRQSPSGASDDFGLGVESEQPGFRTPEAEASAPERRAPDEELSLTVSGRDAGLGLDAGPERAEARQEPAGERQRERRPETAEEGEGPRRRRRRRRRRRGSRGGEGGSTPTTTGAAAVPGSDWDDSTGPEADEIEPEIEPESEAAGETADERFSRGRSGRRHGRRDEDRGEKSREHVPVTFDDDGDEFEDGEKSLAGTGDSEPDVGSASEDETDDESGEHIINYENVPTWEEAISYLLHPSQVQVDSGTGSGASPRGSASADQPRQTRHIGHRKNRR